MILPLAEFKSPSRWGTGKSWGVVHKGTAFHASVKQILLTIGCGARCWQLHRESACGGSPRMEAATLAERLLWMEAGFPAPSAKRAFLLARFPSALQQMPGAQRQLEFLPIFPSSGDREPLTCLSFEWSGLRCCNLVWSLKGQQHLHPPSLQVTCVFHKAEDRNSSTGRSCLKICFSF